MTGSRPAAEVVAHLRGHAWTTKAVLGHEPAAALGEQFARLESAEVKRLTRDALAAIDRVNDSELQELLAKRKSWLRSWTRSLEALEHRLGLPVRTPPPTKPAKAQQQPAIKAPAGKPRFTFATVHDDLARIVAAPDASAPYLAYADVLRRRRDPHGELIRIQHALETAGAAAMPDLIRREAQLLADHPEWLAPLAAHAEDDGTYRHDMFVLRWRRGFIHGARLLTDEPKPTKAALGTLLGLPMASALTELRIGGTLHIKSGPRPAVQPLLDRLRERWPRTLRRLHLDDGDPRDLKLYASAPPLVLGELPPLDELVIWASRIELRARPKVRRLVLQSPRFEPRQLAGDWSELESLELWCPKPELARWLVPASFPKLTSLALVGAMNGDAVCAELAALPISKQLRYLDLRGGTIAKAGARTLAGMAGPELDLRANLIPPASIRTLAKARSEIRLAPQRTGTRTLLADAELAQLASRIWDLGQIAVGWTFPDIAAKLARIRTAIELAELIGHHWSWRDRLTLARCLPAGESVAMMAVLAPRFETELTPPQVAGPVGYVWQSIAERQRELGNAASAKTALWRAYRAAVWTGNEELAEQARTALQIK